MSKKIYIGVSSTARNVKKCYLGLGGVARKVKKGYIGINGVAHQFFTANSYSTVLNENTWAQIKEATVDGLAPSLWAVGDYKVDTISGTVGRNASISGSFRFFIADFNHNSAKEGDNTINFMVKNAAGIDIAFVDSQYNTNISALNYFSMNSSAVNTGGWKSCQMRANICGGATDVTTGSATFYSILPSELRSVIAVSKIYTDNKGGTSEASGNISATYDKIYIPSEYELWGSRSFSNTYEKNSQKQFQYYINGKSKVHYKHNAVSTVAHWWLRSPLAGSGTSFCVTLNDGSAYRTTARVDDGFVPCFKIGVDGV